MNKIFFLMCYSFFLVISFYPHLNAQITEVEKLKETEKAVLFKEVGKKTSEHATRGEYEEEIELEENSSSEFVRLGKYILLVVSVGLIGWLLTGLGKFDSSNEK